MQKVFSHPEDSLQVTPGAIRGGQWRKEQGGFPRRHSMANAGKGAGYGAAPDHARSQLVIVKPKPFANLGRRGGAWARHGGYLQRHGERGFNQEHEGINVSQTLREWQQAGDPYVFKVMVSPEKGSEMHLQHFTRQLMKGQIEPDLGVTLQWVAVEHHHKEHPHIHMVIRGLDAQGQQLWIDGEYLWGGMRQRARELATQMLGLRTQREIDQERAHAIRARGWTLLDKSISHKMPERVTTNRSRPLSEHEAQRLAVLKKRGLAAVDASGRWQLAEGWEEELKEESQKEKEHKSPATERQREEQQKQRQRDIREHEQDDEWER